MSSNDIIRFNPNMSEFRFLAISDTHFGANFDDISKIDKLYNYASASGINNIIHLGDLIEGIKNPFNLRINSIEEQIDYVLVNYPYDSLISNYILLGNHDYNGISISQFYNNLFDQRNDFNLLGIGDGLIQVYDMLILCLHKKQDEKIMFDMIKCYDNLQLVLLGHYHKGEVTVLENGILRVKVPSLSNDMRFDFIDAYDVSIFYGGCEIVLTPLVINKDVKSCVNVCKKVKKL